MRRLIVLAASMLAFAGTAQAQVANSSSATVNGSIAIIQPLTLTKNTDLAFGRVVKPRTGTGTVSIANNSNTVVAGAGAVALSGVTTSRATLTISGEGAQVVSLTIPASFNLTRGASTITVTLSPDLGTTTTMPGTFGTTGTRNLNIGGSLNLPSAQASGAYTGSFTVIAAYQ